MSERKKVTIVGAGATGATCAEVLAQRDYAEIVLTDIKEGLPQGKALDINQMAPILGFEATVSGTNDYADTAGLGRRRDHGRPAAPARDEPRRPRADEREDRQVGDRAGDRHLARRGAHRPVEPARCDVPCRQERLGASRRSASSAKRESSTRPATERSSPGRPARPSRTCMRSCSAATATRWSPWSPRPRSAASPCASSSPRSASRRWWSARRSAAASS